MKIAALVIITLIKIITVNLQQTTPQQPNGINPQSKLIFHNKLQQTKT
jgi:hypothetical protein